MSYFFWNLKLNVLSLINSCFLVYFKIIKEGNAYKSYPIYRKIDMTIRKMMEDN